MSHLHRQRLAGVFNNPKDMGITEEILAPPKPNRLAQQG
jgi:hypothetical protein